MTEPIELLTSLEVAKKVKCSLKTFTSVVKQQPDFPKPVKLTPKSHPKWRDQDIYNYLKNKAA